MLSLQQSAASPAPEKYVELECSTTLQPDYAVCRPCAKCLHSDLFGGEDFKVRELKRADERFGWHSTRSCWALASRFSATALSLSFAFIGGRSGEARPLRGMDVRDRRFGGPHLWVLSYGITAQCRAPFRIRM